MPLTGSQKFATLCLPAAAIGLAFLTAGPDFNPPRPWGSWQAWMEKEEARRAAKDAPSAQASPAAPSAKEPAGPKTPAPAPEPAKPPTSAPSAPPKAPEAPPPPLPPAAKTPALPAPGEIAFQVSGVATAKSASALTFPAAERLDVQVGVSGMARIGPGFPDAEAAKKTILEADTAKKEKGLLFVVPNARSPWEPVRDFLAAGAAGGWKRVALGVAGPEDAAKGRVLSVTLPGNAEPSLAKGMDPIVVKVSGTPTAPTFDLNGEACANGEALAAKAKALHAESEEFTPGYAAEPDATPWIVDGTGATAGGVVGALDALAQAGVPSVRLAGVTRAAPAAPAVEGTEEEAPAEKPAEEKPAEEKPPEEKPAEKKPEGGGGGG